MPKLTTDAAQTMRSYPVTTGAGETLDLGVPLSTRHPLIDNCPTWCVWTDHPVDTHGDDLRHATDRYAVPVRSLPVEIAKDERLAILGSIQASMDQRPGAAPTVWLGIGETNHGADLTLDEADQLIEILRKLTSAARAEITR